MNILKFEKCRQAFFLVIWLPWLIGSSTNEECCCFSKSMYFRIYGATGSIGWDGTFQIRHKNDLKWKNVSFAFVIQFIEKARFKSSIERSKMIYDVKKWQLWWFPFFEVKPQIKNILLIWTLLTFTDLFIENT